MRPESNWALLDSIDLCSIHRKKQIYRPCQVNWANHVFILGFKAFVSMCCNRSLCLFTKITSLAWFWEMHVHFNLIKRLWQRWFHAVLGQQSLDPFFSKFYRRCRFNRRIRLVANLIDVAESWWQDIWIFGLLKICQVLFNWYLSFRCFLSDDCLTSKKAEFLR